MGTGYYDRAGNPITADQWVEAFRSNTIKSTDIGDVHVSTVYLGMDHRFGDDGPPLIFETMVFGGALDQTCERYSAQAEAVADHQRLVEQVRKEQAKDSALSETGIRIPESAAAVADKVGMDEAAQLRFAAPVVAAAFRRLAGELLTQRDLLRASPTATSKNTRMAGLDEAASIARRHADDLDGGSS